MRLADWLEALLHVPLNLGASWQSITLWNIACYNTQAKIDCDATYPDLKLLPRWTHVTSHISLAKENHMATAEFNWAGKCRLTVCQDKEREKQIYVNNFNSPQTTRKGGMEFKNPRKGRKEERNKINRNTHEHTHTDGSKTKCFSHNKCKLNSGIP